jgi:hypothetical protein
MMPGNPSWTRKCAGFTLLFLGVLGTVLPVLQGVLFLALGLFVLRDQYHWARRGMDRLRGRWPRQVEGVEALESRMVLWGRRQSVRLRQRLPRR